MFSKFHARSSTSAIALLLLSKVISHQPYLYLCPGLRFRGPPHAIWDTDQSLHGVPAISPGAPRDKKRGYVVVDEPTSSTDKDHAVISEVKIPASKRATYDLVKNLFDNNCFLLST